MLIGFFLHLKAARLPVSTREFLTLLEALEARVVSLSLDDFYHLARATLVKDEAQYDRYDLAFATYFRNVDALFDIRAEIPEEWLRKEFERLLSAEDKAKVEALGGWDKLMETFKTRLEEQKSRHAGGSKWIGTGGTSPFGAYGYNPEGIRAGQLGSGNRRRSQGVGRAELPQSRRRRRAQHAQHQGRAAKAAPIRTRGHTEELDMDGTIAGTARNAGYLDLHLVPERRNRVKVLLFLDVGGSMDPHISVCEELFSATRTEFRHLEHFYFHNCVYDYVWRDNARRRFDRVATWDILHKYGPDWKVIFVGDAGDEPVRARAGRRFRRVRERRARRAVAEAHRRAVSGASSGGIPSRRARGNTRDSTQIVLQAIGPKMYPLTLDGIASGIDALRH